MPQINPIFDSTSIREGFKNLGTAMFGDPALEANRMKVEHMRAMDEKLHELKLRDQQMREGVYGAQIDNYNAGASADRALAEQRAAENARYRSLADTIAKGIKVDSSGRTIIDPNAAGAILGAISSVNPSVNPGNWLDATSPQAKTPLDPVELKAGSSYATDPTDPRFSSYKKGAADTPLPDLNAPPEDLPEWEENIPNQNLKDGEEPAAVAMGLADAVAPRFDPKTGVVSVPMGREPMGTKSQTFKSFQQFSEDAQTAQGLADRAAALSRPEILQASVNPVASIPGVGAAYDWIQQSSGDPRAQAKIALRDFMVKDWLQKSTLLKGAITERETTMLRASQPGENAAPNIKKNFLDNVGYYARMEAAWNEANARALQNQQPQPIPSEWKAAYAAQNPPPAMPGVFEGKQDASLADTVSEGAAPASGQLKPLTRDVAAQFLQQAGGDKQKAREIARQAGYSF